MFDRMNSAPIRVIAAVVHSDERYLVCLRAPHKRHGGLWEFPGGKCEPNESDEDTVRRELCEELGLEVVAVGSELLVVADPGSSFIIAFIPAAIRGEPQCREHVELRWATLRELLLLPLAPGDRRFAEYLVDSNESAVMTPAS